MKKLILLLVLLTACAPIAPEPTPEIKPTGCEIYFASWETAKNADEPASGQYWYLAENEAMIFVKSEEAGLHELGHFVDMEREYPNQDEAFRNAVYQYVYSPPADVQDELHHYLFVALENEMYDEAFAQLYMWDILYEIPQEFGEFYARTHD